VTARVEREEKREFFLLVALSLVIEKVVSL
jgi:hypothetical protein